MLRSTLTFADWKNPMLRGGVSSELAKSRLSIRFSCRLTVEEACRQKASEYAKKHGLNSKVAG